MRVISGILKGHRINPPQGLDLRPTTDFAKEALFNILEQHCIWPEWDVLDLFSGTGNISFEFSSRGCKSVTAVEKQVQAHRFIRAFSSSKKLNITVFGTDIRVFLKKNTKQFDLVFADVPCSGSGTWGRTPEQLAFFNQAQLDKYTQLQSKIVQNLIPTVAEGGYFLYATCSVYATENERQVESLIASGKFKIIEQAYFKGYTQKADTLFGALLQRVA